MLSHVLQWQTWSMERQNEITRASSAHHASNENTIQTRRSSAKLYESMERMQILFANLKHVRRKNFCHCYCLQFDPSRRIKKFALVSTHSHIQYTSSSHLRAPNSSCTCLGIEVHGFPKYISFNSHLSSRLHTKTILPAATGHIELNVLNENDGDGARLVAGWLRYRRNNRNIITR